MGRRQGELGALAVSMIRRRGINFVGGVAGLAINVTQTGSRSWVLRYTRGGRRRDLGLGGYPDVTLADAKTAARTARAKLAQGIDPVEDGRVARSKLIDNQSIDEQFLAHIEESSLLGLWDRINDYAVARIEGVIAAHREA